MKTTTKFIATLKKITKKVPVRASTVLRIAGVVVTVALATLALSAGSEQSSAPSGSSQPATATAMVTPTAIPSETIRGCPTPTSTPTGTPTPSPTPTGTPTPTPLPTPSPTPCGQFSTSITSNFNAFPIFQGNYIWFTSVLKAQNLPSNAAVTITFTNQTITTDFFNFFMVFPPDATVTFDPSVHFADTFFNDVGCPFPRDTVFTSVPSNPLLRGNTLFSESFYQVPSNLPGGIPIVTWSGTISVDTPGVTVNWQWAAAVYTAWNENPDSLGVKPVDDNVQNPYLNDDHAGTPENFKPFVIGGATGGGGDNYTGDLSGTATVGPCPACSCAPPPGYPSLGCAAQFTVFAMNSPNATQTGTFSNTTVNGDVAASSGVTLKLMAPATVNGNLYLAPGATLSNGGHVNGTIFSNRSQLAQCGLDAINASAQGAALPPNYTFTNITTNRTINGISGLNVVNVTGDINLGSSNRLTLSGPADAFFVVNVGGKIKLGGSGGIFVGGAMPQSHLLINITGSGQLLSTHVGNTIQGTLLGPRVGGSLNGRFGSIILGQNFSLLGGVTLTFGGCNCP
jgi:choice-of-anchor A domain-containing protein